MNLPMFRMRRTAMTQEQAAAQFTVITNTTGSAGGAQTFDPSWVFSDASVMTVDWGDGSAPESHATGLTHSYAAGSGTHRAIFSCLDWSKVTVFNITQDGVLDPLPNLDKLTNLNQLVFPTNSGVTQFPSTSKNISLGVLHAYQNAMTGTLPSFAANTNLTVFRVYLNSLTGAIPSFAACTKLTNFLAYANQFTGYEAGGFATQKSLATLDLHDNQLPTAAIDSILADLVTSLGISGRVACTVDLGNQYGGYNQAPTDLDDVATLQAAGWTVTVSSRPYILTLGDSIMNQLPSGIHTGYKASANLVVNLAVSGTTIVNDGVHGYLLQQVQSVLDHDGAFIFVLMGTNDTVAGETVTTAYEAALNGLKTLNPTASIFGLGILNRTNMVNVVAKNARISTACTNASVTYVDTSSWIIAPDDLSDGVHLNAGGITKVVNAIIALLPA